MSRKDFAFDPTLLDRKSVDTFKKDEPQAQCRSATAWVAGVRRVATAAVLIALLVGAVVLVRVLNYMPAVWPAIEHLLWK